MNKNRSLETPQTKIVIVFCIFRFLGKHVPWKTATQLPYNFDEEFQGTDAPKYIILKQMCHFHNGSNLLIQQQHHLGD